MKNKFVIKQDDTNVYISLYVNSHIMGKILTSLFVLLLIGVLVYVPFTLSKEEVTSFIFPLFIGAVLVFIFPVRYLLWNLYGCEHIIINTKSVSYSREYGLYQTNLKTIKYKRLGTGIEPTREYDDIQYGNLTLHQFDEETDLPELIYMTSVELTFEELERIDNAIHMMHMNESGEDFPFFPISLN